MRKSILITIFLLIIVIAPVKIHAITLGEYESALNKYINEANQNKQAINKTNAEIKASEKRISDLKAEVIILTKEVGKLDEEINRYSNTIKDKIAQSKTVIEYMQLKTNENVYIDFVFRSDSMTDLIYRMAVIKEIIDYNDRFVKNLNKMISDNQAREKEIETRKAEISRLEEDLAKNVTSLGERKASLTEAGVTVSQEIKNYQELVTAYKKLGCKSSDRIGIDCAVSADAGIFRRPTRTGYITQEAYWTASYTHRAVDIGSSIGSREKIYPIANGRITGKYIDVYGALVVVIEHYSAVKKQWYTSLYAHLSSYAPGIAIGQNITSDQYIGYMGTTGKSTGVHLHLEVTPCRMYFSGDPCYTWNGYYNYTVNLYKNGYKGPRSLIAFPNGKYNSWSTR